MKTIAVLTDFSERSAHAARYALHLAQNIKADIVLFNAFLVPNFSSAPVQVSWPADDYEQIKANSELRLKAMIINLKQELKEKSIPGSFVPSLSYQCEEGSVANSIAELEDDDSIVLMVLGTHGPDDKAAFMMGNHCRQIIDAASIPLLIVPENASIGNIEKFVFATDNTSGDIDYINSLSYLAKRFSAEIVVANVNELSHLNKNDDAVVNSFKREISSKVNYERILYRSIPSDSVKTGLEWLVENVNFDVLVMVHHKSSFYDYFFKSSITKKVADYTYVPLLVYPYPVESLPNF